MKILTSLWRKGKTVLSEFGKLSRERGRERGRETAGLRIRRKVLRPEVPDGVVPGIGTVAVVSCVSGILMRISERDPKVEGY